MRKKHIKNWAFPKQYNDEELKELIAKDLDNLSFQKHCEEVADNLNVDPLIVRELLIDNSFTVLSLIQKKVLSDKEVKINITGYFSLIVVHIKYNLKRIKKIKHSNSK